MKCVSTQQQSTALKLKMSRGNDARIGAVGICHDSIVGGTEDGMIKVWGMRPVDESEWEEVDISAMEKDDDGEVEVDGLGYISENYWKNKVTGDIEPRKPSGSENLRLEPRAVKVRRMVRLLS